MAVYGDEQLKLAIAARNKVNAAANELYEKLVPIFRPLVGKQVIKNDNHLLERVKKMLPPIDGGTRYHCYFAAAQYRVYWVVRADAFDQWGSNHESAEATVQIGDLDVNTLKSIYERPEPLKTDYDFADVKAKREAAKRAREAYEAARSECYPFGE